VYELVNLQREVWDDVRVEHELLQNVIKIRRIWLKSCTSLIKPVVAN
jgi:hypothetical protein